MCTVARLPNTHKKKIEVSRVAQEEAQASNENQDERPPLKSKRGLG